MPFPPPGDPDDPLDHLPDPEIEPKFLVSPALAGGFFTTEIPGKPFPCYHTNKRGNLFSFPEVTCVAAAAAAKSLQSCPTLCNPIDGSPPGSAVPGVLQARTLEWVALSFSNA